MDPLTVTIIGGVVVVVIGLFIEYGFFQRRRRNSEDVDQSRRQDARAIDPPKFNLLDGFENIPMQESDGRSWPEAINKAIEDFRILHKGRTIELHHTRTDEWIAWLDVWVWTPDANITSYNLTINKSGKIIKIDQY